MKLTPMIFRCVAASLLFAGSLAQASTITGTVTDKTTGKPAVGDVVVLVNPMAGMSETAHAITDARGHFSLQKAGEGPALLRVKHQGAEYFIEAPHGAGSADISVYDVAAKVDGVGIDEDVIGIVETTGGQLRVVERYAVHNSSAPPRTQWTTRSFEIVLPESAVVDGVSGQRPGGLPTTVKLDPDGAKGHYSFNFPIEPDAGEKGTLFQIEYTLPYSGKLTFHPQVSIPAKTVWVMMPKSMNFAAGAGSAFQSSPQDPAFLTYVSKDAHPGKALEFTVSGNGSLPRDDQGGQQAGSGMSGDASDTSNPGTQPGGGIGAPINTPDPLSKYKWWILGGLGLLMVVAAAFLLRKPITTVKTLEQRYHDGYLVANGIVLIGTIVKILSLFFGAIIIIVTATNSQTIGNQVLFVGIITGVAIALFGFVVGVLISAQGQIMQSMIDTAVNTSPLIDAAEKARLIGIPAPNKEIPPSVER